MSGSVDSFGRLFGACLDETDDLATAFIDPVRQVLDAMLMLGLKVALMGLCDCFGSQSVHLVVDIHEEWHEPSLLRSWWSLCGTWANGVRRTQ